MKKDFELSDVVEQVKPSKIQSAYIFYSKVRRDELLKSDSKNSIIDISK
jgi:hypothetical protein